jgi:hypothetical protein
MNDIGPAQQGGFLPESSLPGVVYDRIRGKVSDSPNNRPEVAVVWPHEKSDDIGSADNINWTESSPRAKTALEMMIMCFPNGKLTPRSQ